MSELRRQFLSLQNLELAWRKVAQNQGCAGVDGETIGQFAWHWQVSIRELQRQLESLSYRPLPLRQLFIPKKDGSWRQLRVPTVRDRLVQQALLQVLYPIIEKDLEDSSFAYRPGRSHHQAAQRVDYWHHRGYDWVFESDIEDYFDSILHYHLLAELRESVDLNWVIDLVTQWVRCGTLTQAGVILPTKGVPQGSVIAPLLSNLYLDDFDEYIEESSLKLVRYGDDFVILAKSAKPLKGLQDNLGCFLEKIGLHLNMNKTQITSFKKGFRFLGYVFSGDLLLPSQPQTHPRKTVHLNLNEPKLIHTEQIAEPTALQLAFLESLRERLQPIPPPLYVVLGYTVRNSESVKIVSHEVIWQNGMSSVYLVQQGATVTKEQGRLVIKFSNGSNEEIPFKAIRQILVFGGIQLSTAVIEVCLQERITIFFLTQLGDYKGHLQCEEMSCLEAQTVQFRLREESAVALGLAQAFIRGKLENSRQLLLRLNRKRRLLVVEESVAALGTHLEQIQETNTLASLLGREGDSAARYFEALGALIVNPGFTWRGRSRRPPLDPVNSLLSLGYTLLFNNVMSLLLAEGLNPYLGHLHHSQSKSPELALDLMEEFRSPVVDSLVLKLINQKTLKPTDFTFPDAEGGVYLTETAKRLFFRSFEERLNDLVSHPDLKESVSYRRAMHLQVIRYKRFLMESIPYESFLRPT